MTERLDTHPKGDDPSVKDMERQLGDIIKALPNDIELLL